MSKIIPIPSGPRMVQDINVYVEIQYEHMGQMHKQELCWKHFCDEHMPIAPHVLQDLLWQLLQSAEVVVEDGDDDRT